MTSESNNLKRDSETLNQKLATSEEEKGKVQEALEQVWFSFFSGLGI